MSRRPGVQVVFRRPAPTGESPNVYVGETTCDVRVFWTPTTPLADVLGILIDAVADAVERVVDRDDWESQ